MVFDFSVKPPILVFSIYRLCIIFYFGIPKNKNKNISDSNLAKNKIIEAQQAFNGSLKK